MGNSLLNILNILELEDSSKYSTVHFILFWKHVKLFLSCIVPGNLCTLWFIDYWELALLTSNIYLQYFVSPDNSDEPSCLRPALLMQTSTPPYCFFISLNIVRISSSFLKSHLMASKLPDLPLSSSAIAWKLGSYYILSLFIYVFVSASYILNIT
jgi:hypothetical protein